MEPKTHREEHRHDSKRKKFLRAFEDLNPSDFRPEEWASIQHNLSVKANHYKTPNLPEP